MLIEITRKTQRAKCVVSNTFVSVASKRQKKTTRSSSSSQLIKKQEWKREKTNDSSENENVLKKLKCMQRMDYKY